MFSLWLQSNLRLWKSFFVTLIDYENDEKKRIGCPVYLGWEFSELNEFAWEEEEHSHLCR